MTRDDIRTVYLATLHAIAPEVDLTAIRADRPLREQIDLDSMDLLNVMIGLGEKLGVDVPEADYGRMTTVDEAVTYLLDRVEAGQSSRRTGTPA
jgi:acyl carrier protein